MHFDVPDVNNSVGVSLRIALVNSGKTSVSVMTPGNGSNGTISATDITRLSNGVIVERVVSVPLEGEGMTNAQRQIAVRTLYAKEDAEVQRQLSAQLRYFGLEQNRP